MDGRAWKIRVHTEERRYRSGLSMQTKMRSCADTTRGVYQGRPVRGHPDVHR